MSYGRFATANTYGLRRTYTAKQLGAAYRSPSQAPARPYMFATRGLAGMGAVAIQDPIEIDGTFSATGPASRVAPIYTHRIYTPGTRAPFSTEASQTPTSTPSASSGTAPASSSQGAASTPTLVSSQPTTQIAQFPANPTIGQTFQDNLGDVWQYTSQGWQIAAHGPTSQQQSILPSSPSVGQTYTDPSGNIWVYTSSGWAMSVAVGETPGTSTVAASATPSSVALTSGAATTAQVGTPVPVGQPTDEPYTDSSGNIWTWTATSGWQITGNTASAANASNWASSITAWLQESTIVSGVENFWIVGGAGAAGLVLYGMFNRGKH